MVRLTINRRLNLSNMLSITICCNRCMSFVLLPMLYSLSEAFNQNKIKSQTGTAQQFIGSTFQKASFGRVLWNIKVYRSGYMVGHLNSDCQNSGPLTCNCQKQMIQECASMHFVV
jgi:hypothetical protein